MSSLFKFKTYSGSIKKVAPDCERSCTKPFTLPLYSALTGITYLSFLMVTMLSCKYAVLAPVTYSERLLLILSFKFLILLLIEYSASLAKSLTCSEFIIFSVISLSSASSKYRRAASPFIITISSSAEFTARYEARAERSRAFTSSNSPQESAAPFAARRTRGRTSGKYSTLPTPYLNRSLSHSCVKVSLSRTSATSLDGARFLSELFVELRQANSAQAHRILSSSSLRKFDLSIIF